MNRAVQVIGSVLCFSGIAAAAVYLAQGRAVDAAVLMLVGLGQALCLLLLRSGWARGGCSLILLSAGVSAAQLLYERIPGWDLVIHILATGVLVLLWRNLRLRRRPGSPPRAQPRRPAFDAALARHRAVMCALAGLVLALIWEAMELIGFLVVSPEIYIPPMDTFFDVVGGVAGAAAVGLLHPPRVTGSQPARAHDSTVRSERLD